MRTLYKVALAPFLLAQSRKLRATALRLPEPEGNRAGIVAAPKSTESSDESLRILVVGDSSAAGVGVEHQQDALAMPLAHLVAQKTGRQVQWHLYAKSGLNTREAHAFLDAQMLPAADLIVVALGVNDVTAQHSAEQFIADYQQLLRMLFNKTCAQKAVISGLPPLHQLPVAPQPLRWYLGQCAKRLDLALQKLCARTANLSYVSLQWAKAEHMARDKFHPGPSQYLQWAALISEAALRGAAPPDSTRRNQVH